MALPDWVEGAYLIGMGVIVVGGTLKDTFSDSIAERIQDLFSWYFIISFVGMVKGSSEGALVRIHHFLGHLFQVDAQQVFIDAQRGRFQGLR